MSIGLGKRLLHNALPYITILLLFAVLASCGSGEDSLFSVERHRAHKEACLEYGYPDYWVSVDTKVVFCLRRSECTDEVVKLSDLRKRGQ